ncbi:hypothetical protein FQN49_008415 [Arthroderma sp. PD_2]|nr:hypothetical protein FQN49_008415 [Arthroderma sp. PD_2]
MTDRSSVEDTLKQIRSSMPLLGGVANGAMVLCDKMFHKMTYNEFQRVTQPKVNGTIYLDSLLSENNIEPLDWFIAFSSIVATRGNPGQCNYAAANCFMKAFVNGRRARGLAGSSIDISRVVGVGYVERESQAGGRLTKEQKKRLVSGSMSIPISETDIHHLFAEAVVAGRPGSSSNPELITGIAPVRSETANMNMWPGNPMFGLLVKEGDEAVVESSTQVVRLPVKVLLEEAKSEKEVFRVLKECLTDKVLTALFMSSSDNLSATIPLLDFGVDSLIAVEIRAWFLKELTVDVPVMRILGGASIEELSEYCLTQMGGE